MSPFDIFISPWSLIIRVIAIIHFIRRRPDNYWLWIIIIGGWIGSLVYIVAEVIPDCIALRPQLNLFARRNRIRQLEAVVRDNPSPGNYEDLGAVYFDDHRFQRAKDAYDKAITPRTTSPDPYYRRSLAELELADYAGAVNDLQHVIAQDSKYDFGRAQGLLAHALACTGQFEPAAAQFQLATQTSTLSETMYNYAWFLNQTGRSAEARAWAQKVVDKKHTLPGYLKRRERPWFRRAAALLKQMPK